MPSTELTPKQQLAELIRSSTSFLLTTHANADGDGLGSALALGRALTKLGKQVTIATDGTISSVYSFLPGIAEIQNDFSINKDLLIIIDESQAKVGNVSLKRVSETKLMIVVSPKDGLLTGSTVRIEDGSFSFDAVVVLDCPSSEQLGGLAERCADLLYEVPVVNIDHHAGNTNFGKVNLVDLAASSTSEIIVSILEMLGREQQGLLDAETATCLLAGIIADTSSFQNANTTPKSLTVAAQLVAAGAKQQEIVRQLFRNRSLATLRLWGRALSYIKEDAGGHFAWSTLSKADYVASQATPDMAPLLVDELLKQAAGVSFVLLLSEEDGSLTGRLRAVDPSTDVRAIALLFGGTGHPQAASFTLQNTRLQDSEQEIITKIRNHTSTLAKSQAAG